MPDPADALDPPTRATLAVIADAGYVVNIRQDAGLYVATATRPDGQVWIARAPDPYTAAVELAGQVGIDLEDG